VPAAAPGGSCSAGSLNVRRPPPCRRAAGNPFRIGKPREPRLVATATGNVETLGTFSDNATRRAKLPGGARAALRQGGAARQTPPAPNCLRAPLSPHATKQEASQFEQPRLDKRRGIGNLPNVNNKLKLVLCLAAGAAVGIAAGCQITSPSGKTTGIVPIGRCILLIDTAPPSFQAIELVLQSNSSALTNNQSQNK
jgi:hypothetical protein